MNAQINDLHDILQGVEALWSERTGAQVERLRWYEAAREASSLQQPQP